MTKQVPFRRQAKTDLNVMVPERLAEDIRNESDLSGRTIGSLVTEYICRGMGRDPADFGILQPRRPKPQEASA